MTKDKGQRTKDELEQGIKAAKNGDKAKARDLLYAVVDKEPRNETAWVWLSYAVESVEDRQVCLENVLTVNPTNQYALRGLTQISDITRKQQATRIAGIQENKQRQKASQVSPQVTPRPLALMLITAFWFGLGMMLFAAGIMDIIVWFINMTRKPLFPDFITPSQLWLLSIPVLLLSLGILLLNTTWALYVRHKFGYYASIILALGFTLVIPAVISISSRPNYLLAVFAAVMPTSILFLTLMSQTGFDHE